MNNYNLIVFLIVILISFNACNDDEESKGNPVINSKTDFSGAMFGDSLPFTVTVSDDKIPLSTLKAELYYSEDKVSETVIRTKTNGDYTGKIFIPYYKNIPNGTAKIKLILQNIEFAIKEEMYDLPLIRPDFPYLILVTAKEEYRMARIGLYEYEATDNFTQKISGYIKAPVAGPYGNEINFGWENEAVIQHSTGNIPFSNFAAGEYTVTFNTFNYEASPFIIAYAVNDLLMERVDNNNYKADLYLKKGQEVKVEGFNDFDNWWIDPDFFYKDSKGKLTFAAPDGNYRMIADLQHTYLKMEVLDADNNPASLQADGSGAVWIIGEGIGKPSVATNAVGWNAGKALCMVPMGDKKYQISVVGDKTVKSDNINFKFFHQKGWGGEFTHTALSTADELIFIGDKTNGRDAGNLGLNEGRVLEENVTYVFILDLTEGNDNAVVSVVKK
jgi:hypothetical protein